MGAEERTAREQRGRGAGELEANAAEAVSFSAAPQRLRPSVAVSPSAPPPLCPSAVSQPVTFRPVALAVFLLSVALAAQAADPFYMRLLRQGTDAYNRSDFVAAVRQLRIACFGLLDEPELLADGLVRLGLAQASAGDTAGFAETFQRLAEVEERFAGYSKASIPNDVRDAFQKLVLNLIPRSTLAERPAIARLMPAPENRAAKPTPVPATPRATAAPTRSAVPSPSRTVAVVAPAIPPADASTLATTATPTPSAVPSPSRTAAVVAPAIPPADASTQAPTATPTRSAVPSPSWTAVAVAPTTPPTAVATPVSTAAPTRTPPAPRRTPVSAVPTPSEASVAVEPVAASGSLTSPPPIVPPPPPAAATPSLKRAPTAAEKRELDAIQELVGKDKIGDALARARRLADAQADLTEAQFVAAELAYRTLRWPEAVAYFRRGGDPGDARPLLLFYEAVSLYETGDADGAAAVLKRSLPKVRHTSYVESYVQKILGPGAANSHKP